MRIRTLFAVVLLVFSLPCFAADNLNNSVRKPDVQKQNRDVQTITWPAVATDQTLPAPITPLDGCFAVGCPAYSVCSLYSADCLASNFSSSCDYVSIRRACLCSNCG